MHAMNCVPHRLIRCCAVATLLVVCPCNARAATDEREGFSASLFNGLGIDSFAADDLNKYINPEESGVIRERFVFGIDFAYRVAKWPTRRGNAALWFYGETVHGLRSADVDLAKDSTLFALAGFSDPGKIGKRSLFILRNARSLEAFAGTRFEFGEVGPTDSRAKLYFKIQAGFLAVAGSGKDVVDVHHLGIGLIAIQGEFRDSYLEVGFGRTDLFQEHSDRRLKVDGFLSWSPSGIPGWIPFAQFTVDADAGGGSDSIQSYFGVDIEFHRAFTKQTKKGSQ